jgi:2,4-dienoyl-CoA reductase-like NADH-dependent reductase (Old Yellow Enzyme family)
MFSQGFPMNTPLLLTPITLRGLTARNRIVVSPMSQYAAEDGAPTDWHLVHLGKFAMGGAGIVFVEETTVEERARKTYHCPASIRMRRSRHGGALPISCVVRGR